MHTLKNTIVMALAIGASVFFSACAGSSKAKDPGDPRNESLVDATLGESAEIKNEKVGHREYDKQAMLEEVKDTRRRLQNRLNDVPVRYGEGAILL